MTGTAARRCAALLLVAALALPAPALAQDNPFGPLPQAPAAPTATPTPTSTPGEGTTGRNTLFAIAGALVIAFMAMGVWIARDARRARGMQDDRSRLREEGPHRRPRQAKAKARARTRAQKAARRRNR